MSSRMRLLLTTLLSAAAVLVPLQAGALQGPGGGLNVGASFHGCGSGASGVSCQIDVSWSGAAGADHYTADVTLADGSVRGLGRVGAGELGGGTSIWVPYAGNGLYVVTVTAWAINEQGEKEKVDEDEAETDASETRDGDEAKPQDPEADKGPEPDGDGGNGKDESPEEVPSPDPSDSGPAGNEPSPSDPADPVEIPDAQPSDSGTAPPAEPAPAAEPAAEAPTIAPAAAGANPEASSAQQPGSEPAAATPAD